MDPRFPWLFPRPSSCEFGRGLSELLICSYYYIIISIIKASVLESSLLLSRLYCEPCAVLCFPVNLGNVLCFVVVFGQFRAKFFLDSCQDVFH